jgi:hypothetical protein
MASAWKGNATLRGTSARATIPTAPSSPLQPRHLNSLPSPSLMSCSHAGLSRCNLRGPRTGGKNFLGTRKPHRCYPSPSLLGFTSGSPEKIGPKGNSLDATSIVYFVHIWMAPQGNKKRGMIPKRGLQCQVPDTWFELHPPGQNPTFVAPSHCYPGISYKLKDAPAVELHGKLILTPTSERCLPSRANDFLTMVGELLLTTGHLTWNSLTRAGGRGRLSLPLVAMPRQKPRGPWIGL